ncbi:MAG: hypothetical protein WBY69_25425, partial [Candidatus Acidiferrales bacterium]
MMVGVKASRFVIMLAALLVVFGGRAQCQQNPPPAPPAAAPAQPGGEPAQNDASGEAAQSPQQSKTPPIVSTTGLVHLVATVTDRHRNFITDL